MEVKQMENIKQAGEKILEPKKLVFEPPMISVIQFTETDIITTSGGPWEEIPEEGERIR